MKTSVSPFFLLILVVLGLGNASATEYFVRSGGDDAADGLSAATAFGTVQKGLDALAGGDILTLEPGEYQGVASRKDLGNLEVETLIRARIPGTVTLRGDRLAPEFQPLEGHPHVYVADFAGPVEAVNEVDSLKVLSNVADAGEVAFSPGSFSFDPEKKKLFISSTDMRPVEDHHYTISVVSGHGLLLTNPTRVIVDGLSFRGFNSMEPLRDSGPQYTVWGLYLAGARDCIVRHCRAFLSGGGILITPGKEGGGNLIDHCEGYAAMAPHSAEMGAISIFGPKNDTIRNSSGYLSGGAGIRLYGNPFTGVNGMENCLVWGTMGRGLDIKGGGDVALSYNRNSVGLGLVNGQNIFHNIIGKGNVYMPPEKISNDNVVLSRDGLNSRREFADPENFDFRLQSTSSLRDAAPDGSDRGPFPYLPNIYYVRAGGNDEADGLSIKTAWKTPARAVRDLKAGDTVYFGRGDYKGPLTILAGKSGTEPIHLRARGVEPVVLGGPVTVKNGKGVEFERLRFAETVTLEGGRDLSFKNCRFAGEEEGLAAVGVTDLRISHGEFLGSMKSGISLRNCSAVQLTDNIFDNTNANSVGVVVTKAPDDLKAGVEKVIAFSDRNAYASPDRAWSWNGTMLALADLPGQRDAHSFSAGVSLGEEKGFPVVTNPEAFAGRGTDGKGVGFHQDLLGNELFMSAPRVHSVSATTANIEWLVSRGADCEVAWGETPDCKNEERFTIEINADRFRSFSLTGLKPGTTYYFRIKSIQLLPYPDYGTAAVKDPKYEIVSFTTLAKEAPPQVYYVATDGSDQNSGRERSQAWKTVSYAAGAVAPGDTVMVAGGTYPEQVRVRVTGDTGKPIRFLSLPGERVVFDGVNRRLENAWTISGKTNITVDGFYFYNHRGSPGGNTSSRLFNVVASKDILIRRCLMDGRGGGAYPASFLTGWTTENLTISNCVSILAPDGIEISGCPGFRLEHSVFILTMICNVKLSTDATLIDNIFCDSGVYKSGQNIQLAQFSSPEKIVDKNNCYYFRLPTDERTAFFVPTAPRDWDNPWERITLPALKKRVPSNDSIVADPEFAILKNLSPEKRKPFSVDVLYAYGIGLTFSDLFTTNPELIKRGIGLQPELFADFAHNVEPAKVK